MANLEPSKLLKSESQPQKQTEPKLKGTLLSVMLVGGFIILSWIGVYALYLSR
ncbi:cytochrome c oxidase subunit 2A [Virgibacillus senegalensis]|uniref:cytochrome c oxidase subunit 2A n=1 Tax=Virgibacillus senegalensis TaxID=1499679 RepID=UPI000AB84187|nr:cytochrome c oxidase subunit 2A [Virgibacillus senegalensis]